MNVKVICHLMPWEIDYALLTFTQLKKSKYFLSKEDNITIETVLNLSSYLIDWNKSQLPKEFFIKKYDQISNLLSDYTHIKRIYEEDKLYGHLNLQKECPSSEIDAYVAICPDMYFHEHLLSQMIEGAKQIPNEYFVITPQTSKLWDPSWDILVNPLYQHIPYEKWYEVDTFDIIFNDTYNALPPNLKPIDRSKYAGWFDLYNKNFYENLVPVWEEWEGYGSWDWYSLVVSQEFKNRKGDFQQYVLEGKTIFEYPIGNLFSKGFSNYYKDFITLNSIPDQKENFKSKVEEYTKTRLNQLFPR